jgi:hypothetical protein
LRIFEDCFDFAVLALRSRSEGVQCASNANEARRGFPEEFPDEGGRRALVVGGDPLEEGMGGRGHSDGDAGVAGGH